jgi:hypothetical protein
MRTTIWKADAEGPSLSAKRRAGEDCKVMSGPMGHYSRMPPEV